MLGNTPAAVKLLTCQLAYLTAADKKFRTADGLEIHRVWIQARREGALYFVATSSGSVSKSGSSVKPDANSFEVTDETGPPLLVRGSAGERALGEYVLVVGKLGLRRIPKIGVGNRSQDADGTAAGKRQKDFQLAAQKVRALSGASRRAGLWHQEDVQTLSRAKPKASVCHTSKGSDEYEEPHAIKNTAAD
ncbi:hypothetical protein VOLCADRAFT_99033 [Volvox carteri f. nagariensis]|uniref:Uncharacterized protein n=1 Tax=Volvox carteri f. nagariensis TaxID=3068 RepID=D8UGW0_VOLCA|nr:uncharacterized protein VOLCADRAFT_99033 [Volvox carteri f. nagariensis]EFJ41019.1 hypothetical protein VOLCADRAFT_99033 [Volvox carteri f. nagariensis]|eukprot:XP_002957883.1 hypothetical protein VOLCADRAFT_99033 [Volvox carteri f. nagariensis]